MNALLRRCRQLVAQKKAYRQALAKIRKNDCEVADAVERMRGSLATYNSQLKRIRKTSVILHEDLRAMKELIRKAEDGYAEAELLLQDSTDGQKHRCH